MTLGRSRISQTTQINSSTQEHTRIRTHTNTNNNQTESNPLKLQKPPTGKEPPRFSSGHSDLFFPITNSALSEFNQYYCQRFNDSRSTVSEFHPVFRSFLLFCHPISYTQRQQQQICCIKFSPNDFVCVRFISCQLSIHSSVRSVPKYWHN